MHEDLELNMDPMHQVNYHLESSLEYSENNRYVQEITGEINRLNEDQHTYTPASRLQAFKVLLNIGAESGWNAFSVFDVHHNTLEVGEQIYDFENETWDENGSKYYGDEIFDSDVLILSRIEILPEFRGQ